MPLILSFCTGTGGLDVGVQSALSDNSLTAWFSENDAQVADWYQQWSPDGLHAAPIGDLKEIDWELFRQEHPSLYGGDAHNPVAENLVLTGGYQPVPTILSSRKEVR